ncbi:uncharacterized protein CLUP02_09382 [Colletotrichum lupini]|uniref:Uncharacterized protein n=1 Tax=Colletotrichum lupini TaxID=145971 RepID=A0A9Q8WHW7_9PEZI|nr:uncharacterized protein CLUP02_09382 [Colletotrichum lupini]UQC83886.1 hypothetical protein CLUP02_09382 [Colletotrichum lupini]
MRHRNINHKHGITLPGRWVSHAVCRSLTGSIEASAQIPGLIIALDIEDSHYWSIRTPVIFLALYGSRYISASGHIDVRLKALKKRSKGYLTRSNRLRSRAERSKIRWMSSFIRRLVLTIYCVVYDSSIPAKYSLRYSSREASPSTFSTAGIEF